MIRRLSLCALIFACSPAGAPGTGSSSTIRGSITDGSGTEPQASRDARGLGGAGTVQATAKVRVSSIGANGMLTSIAETEVSLDGRYEVAVQPSQAHLVVHALDVNGRVIAGAVIDATASAGSTIDAPPMDSESSLEAAVLVEMTKRGAVATDVSTIDLRTRINANVTASVFAAGVVDTAHEVAALADAEIAAQRTKAKAYARLSSAAQTEIKDQEIRAAWKLNEALAKGGDVEPAYDALFDALAVAVTSNGVSTNERAQVEANASAAYRGTLKASTSTGATIDAAVRAAAIVEGRAMISAMKALYLTQPISTAAKQKADTAIASFEAELRAATSAAAAKQAFVNLTASVSGDGAMANGLVGLTIEVTAATEVQAQAAITATQTAAVALDGALDSALKSYVLATEAIDFDALAAAVLTAQAAFVASVESQAAGMSTLTEKREVAIDAMILVYGSFCLAG